MVRYEYDSWGNILSIKDSNGNNITSSTNIGIINPYRYRSYRYDTETGLYYLQSRYYNSEWGRFINADAYVQTGQGMLDKNMYSYCENNPISRLDSSGNGWFTNFLVNRLKNTALKITKSVLNIISGTSKYVGLETVASENQEETLLNGAINITLGVSKNVNSKSFNKPITVSIKGNTDISTSSISVGIASRISNIELDIGAKDISASAGVKIKNNTYSLMIGNDKENSMIYVGTNINTYINSANTIDEYNKYGMNKFLFVTTVGAGIIGRSSIWWSYRGSNTCICTLKERKNELF